MKLVFWLAGIVSIVGVIFITIYSMRLTHQIYWDGQLWGIKASSQLSGAGPNYFSPKNITVRSDGLHLKITEANGRWYASSIHSLKQYGYGQYTWNITAPLLDPAVVFGNFIWNNDPIYNHREIDFEITKFGHSQYATNAQFTTEPYSHHFLDKRITVSPGHSTITINWQPSSIVWTLVNNGKTQQWKYAGTYIPKPSVNVYMNLWPFTSKGPLNGKQVEVVVNSFSFKKS